MNPREAVGLHAALASPVRQRVLDVLRDAAEAPTAQLLAAQLGLHVTTVRFHLDQLEQTGLVERETRHANRLGRPSVHYRAAGVDAARAEQEMIGALADLLDAGLEPGSAVSAGVRWAQRLPAPVAGTRETITQVFTKLGFEPEATDDLVRLRSCPYREAARQHPQVLCRVHLGLAQGLAARTADGVDVALAPFVEPELCVLTLSPPREPAVVP